jgi:hypothetical protein
MTCVVGVHFGFPILAKNKNFLGIKFGPVISKKTEI